MKKVFVHPKSVEVNPDLRGLVDCPGSEPLADGFVFDADSPCAAAILAKPPPRAPAVNKGFAGEEMTKIFGLLGFKSCATCHDIAGWMDREGDDWCRANKPWIVAYLVQRRRGLKPREAAAAIMRAMTSVTIFTPKENRLDFIDPADIAGSIFDESLKRSESRLKSLN